ncbi:MAG: ArnT family glycosyltransferase [Pyrinomonadaceae bacterium]
MKTENLSDEKTENLLRENRRKKWLWRLFIAFIFSLTLAAHIFFAVALANDEPNDGKLYAQMAKNLLEQNVFSAESAPPFTPTIIRLPGYPLFLAGIYSIFGHDNNTAARVVQGIFNTATCLLIALLALNWTANEKLKRRAFWLAYFLAALCPFTAIYAATILTETLTIFLLAAMTLAATYAFKTESLKPKILWWISAGILSGLAVLLRPDSGLFAAGIGLTIVVTGLFQIEKRPSFFSKFKTGFLKIIWQGTVFSIAFILPLVPWTIRNEQVFGVFQPLAPAHAEAPGEFVAFGYFRWVRTWIDDEKYIEPTLWNLDDKPIKIEQIPASAFDGDEEKSRVAALLKQYNQTPDEANDSQDSPDDKSGDKDDSADSGDDASDNSDADNSDNNDNADNSDQNSNDNQNVEMTPEIDAGFAQIADERIARAPFRYYVGLPAKRAASMWLDTHSQYYPFAGELFPLKDLDEDENQQIWLPVFAVLTWIYTLFGIVGAFVLWRTRSIRWLLLAALLIFPRVAFFAMLENPEPRYVVELFAVASALGGIALAHIKFKRRKNYFSIGFFYGKD